ncbi:MAG: L-aspartate oxidase [Acidiferrobacteraceae bacterium]|jgi:L-aspartate oxidase|nr:L-aspartate oxidase [Acidiferrobacteraceae bacterium]MDP6123131.1 L-aspartate oxidase [Arenicellales bacterium]MDP6435548.1 L-aspartate oxidase [Arenicellales bacterium]MDP6672247.1 L-aspartate oxidase [Arenicellales bacterium]MDP6723793.1 L-aspartate oxidase [Arenicellales bacterium]|tara:strand:+ start:1879 stop:3489 length:1611 start_codon:yes stop_codon:yes gene_type:complete
MAITQIPEVIVVGGGLAGLSLALRLAKSGKEVVVLSKQALTEGSSLYAQGGIAAVLAENDTFESHIEDTLIAGAGICHRETVDRVVRQGPASIDWLLNVGVSFSQAESVEESPFHLTREGGHSHRRVIHSADATGRAIELTLESQLRSHPKITLLENHLAIDIITSHHLNIKGKNRVHGIYVLDRHSGKVITLPARHIALATGGAAKAYLYTSNPDTSTGDGIAMAWRAGCRVGNLEFIQFHPTCLYHPQAKSFLISEAVRGEGGRLLLPDGSPFMLNHDQRGELAPRDIVARAIDYEMKRRGVDCVYLDISHRSTSFIKDHFPTIHQKCLDFGFDMATEPLPVVPAAHYTCGGIVTNKDGSTDLEGLYTLGECSFTGLHGANRLASNSLLECLVYASATSEAILQRNGSSTLPDPVLPSWDESRVTDADERIVVSHNWDELRRFMWDYVGIVRTTKRLERAAHRIALLNEEILEYYSHFRVTNDLIELRNLTLVAELIVRCAQMRKESRGLHYTLDYPEPDNQTQPGDTILSPNP